MLEKNQVLEIFKDDAGNYYASPRTVDTDCSSAKGVKNTENIPQLIKLGDIASKLKPGDFPSGFTLDDLGCIDTNPNPGNGTGTTDNDPAADIDFSPETSVTYFD